MLCGSSLDIFASRGLLYGDMSALSPKQLPSLAEHKAAALEIIKDYQCNRIDWYSKIKLSRLLQKDLTMFVARGVDSAEGYLEEAFRAAESSSEETVMGNRWQRIIAQISTDTIDSGDLTTERDGVVWVCEVKSQTNTTNSSSFPQELRALRVRMEEISRRRRATNKPVKAAICITRDNKAKDETRVYRNDWQRENEDLNGFEYRYITGEKFWRWLTDYPSEVGLLMPLSEIKDGDKVAEARTQCILRLKRELLDLLSSHNLKNTVDDIVELRNLI